MEDQLKKIFFDLIFRPVLDLLLPYNAQMKSAAKELRNASDRAVLAALRSGKVQYTSGTFSGDFNASISKELKRMGAKWNKTTKTFSLPPNKLPESVAALAQEYNDTAKKVHKELEKRLAEVQKQLETMGDIDLVDADETVDRVQKGFEKSAGSALGTEADLSEAGRKKLSEEYTENLSPYIKKFAGETISELRQMVADNAQQGYRFDKLVTRIQGRYEVSQTKAKFLAKQETSILVSKHRQVRFEEVGVTRYIWRTSHDSRVRDRHKELDGREFLYSQPPVTDPATGTRNNPGQDFGCRCVDFPLLPGVKVEA